MKQAFFSGAKSRRRLFFQNALILLAGSFAMRTLGLGFGVYLSGKMGAEGMGLFQLVSTVYGLASTFATSGIYLTVTRLVAEEVAAGNTPARTTRCANVCGTG